MSTAQRLRDAPFGPLPLPTDEELRALRLLDAEFQDVIMDRPFSTLRVGSVVSLLSAVNTLAPFLRLISVVLHARRTGVAVRAASQGHVRLVAPDGEHLLHLPRFGAIEEAHAWLRLHDIPLLDHPTT